MYKQNADLRKRQKELDHVRESSDEEEENSLNRDDYYYSVAEDVDISEDDSDYLEHLEME